MNNRKVLSIIIIFLTAVGYFLPELVGYLSPIVNITFTSAIILIILSSYSADQISYYSYVAGITVISVVYRARILSFGGSMLGADPDLYALDVSRVVREGYTSAIWIGFYDQAPIHILQSAMVTIVSGLPSPISYGSSTVLTGILVPLTSAAIVRRLCPESSRLIILSAGATSLLAYNLRYSWNPIAQTTGHLFFLLPLLSILVLLTKKSRSWFIVFFIMIIASFYTHKLSVIMVAFAIIGITVIFYFQSLAGSFFMEKKLLILLTLSVLLVVVQQLLFTTQILAILYNSPQAIPISQVGAAKEATSEIGSIFQQLYVYGLAIVGGICWIWWAKNNINREDSRINSIYIGSVGGLAFVSVLVFLGPQNIARAIQYAEVPLLILIIVSIKKSANDITAHRACLIIVLIFIIVFAGAPASSPDYGSDRMYLTVEESNAKLWGIKYLNENVNTDSYYYTETPPELIVEEQTESTIIGKNSDKFKDGSIYYLNNSLGSIKSMPVAHRSCTESTATEAGAVYLQYNPEDILNINHDRVFDSGCVSYFSGS